MTQKYPKIKLALFFTRQISLESWYSNGSLSREIAIYQALREYNVQTTFFTYGTRKDIELAQQVVDFPVRANNFNWHPKRYERWLHLFHAPTLLQMDVIKTNQTNGADIAMRAAKFWRKPLVARFGYMHSLFVEQAHGEEAPITKRAYQLEADVFNYADAIIGTSPRMIREIDSRFTDLPTHVIPNYVDIDVFKPLDLEKKVDLTFVGRLHEQKNLFALLEALEPLDVTCRLIGDGALKKELQARFGTLDGRVIFHGRAPNHELPHLINQSRVFIMPSLYEGHPKALIEAMSCGVPVIGTKVNGTKEVLEHGQNGWLCETTPESIREAITHLLNYPDLRQTLAANARAYVLENYNLKDIAAREYDIIRSVIN